MPNYCENVLTVVGEPAELAALKKSLEGEFSPLSFNNLVPDPHPKSNYMTKEQEEWRYEHWGTCWEVNEDQVMIDEQPGSITYEFDTAWDPPLAWLKTLAAQWLTLKFYLKYDEEGMEVHGVWQSN